MQEKSKRAIKIFVVICMMASAFLMYGYIILVSRQHIADGTGDAYLTVQHIVYILLILLLGFVCYMILLRKKPGIPLERLFLIMGLTLGFVYILSIPLMAVPDEQLHIYTAYDVSDTMMGTRAETVMMRDADMQHVYNNRNLTREDFNSQYEGAFQSIGNQSLLKTDIVATQTPRYLYLFSGLGITIGRLLGLSTTLTYLLGRMFNMLVFMAAAFYAIKRMPFGKGIVMVWALLPITLQQVCSFSYDSPLLGLCGLLIATTMSAVYGQEENKKARIVNNVVLVVSCVLLIPCKGFALLPLAALPLMVIPRIWQLHADKLEMWKQKVKPWMKVVCICVICLIVAGIGIVVARKVHYWMLPENADGAYVDWADGQAYSIGYFIRTPLVFCEMMLNTLWYRTDLYLKQILGGMLGWLDIEIPLIFCIGFLILLLYVSLRKEDEEQLITNKQRIWMLVVFAGTCFLAVIAMLLYWTPRTSAVVEGVQGRYFLPVVMLALLALRTKRTCVSRNADQYAAVWVAFLQVLVVTAIFRNIP